MYTEDLLETCVGCVLAVSVSVKLYRPCSVDSEVLEEPTTQLRFKKFNAAAQVHITPVKEICLFVYCYRKVLKTNFSIHSSV